MNDKKSLEELVKDNNRMLKEIILFINLFGKNIDSDNTGDFGRNVLANMISNVFEGNVNNRRY